MFDFGIYPTLPARGSGLAMEQQRTQVGHPVS